MYAPGYFLDADAGNGGGTTPPDAGGNGGKTFTQDQVDALVGNARKEGRDGGVSKLLKDLGVENADSLKALVDNAKKADDANKTELQKLNDQLALAQKKATDAEAQAAKDLAALKERVLVSEIKIAASNPVLDKDNNMVRAAFRAEALGDLAVLIDRSLINEKDGNYEGIDKALEALAKSRPFLLAESSAEPRKAKGTPNPAKKPVDKQPNPEQRPALKQSILS